MAACCRINPQKYPSPASTGAFDVIVSELGISEEERMHGAGYVEGNVRRKG